MATVAGRPAFAGEHLLLVPLSWSEAAYLISREAASFLQAGPREDQLLRPLLVDLAAANEAMTVSRKALSSSQRRPAEMVMDGASVAATHLTPRYMQSLRSLVESMRADMASFPHSRKTFELVVTRFDIEEEALRRHLSAGPAIAGAPEQVEAPTAAPKAKALSFDVVGEPEDMCRRCETPFGVYELNGFPKGWMVTFLLGSSGRRISDKTGVTLEQAMGIAQVDFETRIAACLAPEEPHADATAAPSAPARKNHPR